MSLLTFFYKAGFPFIEAPPKWHKHLLNVPSNNIITLGVRVSTYWFGRETNIYSIATASTYTQKSLKLWDLTFHLLHIFFCIGNYLNLLWFASQYHFLTFFKIYLFLHRGRGREKEGKRHQYVAVSCVPPYWGPGP